MSRRSTPRLDARLAAVAELVPESARVADVGADHGRLALALLASGRVASCLATEATPARLARLAASVARHPLGSRLELRGGWGLGPLRIEDRLDCLVLAGMGGLKIAGILAGGGPRRAGGVGATVPGNRSPGEVDRLGVARLVLQPATEAAGLRRWLHANRLRLLDERLAFAGGREHVVLAATPGEPWLPEHPTLTADDLLEVGPCLVARRDAGLSRVWGDTLARTAAILEGATAGRGRDEALRQHAIARRVLSALAADAAP